MIVRRVLLSMIVVGALTLAGCGGSGEERQPDPGAVSASSAGDGHDFIVATLDGATFDGRSLAGKPAVFVVLGAVVSDLSGAGEAGQRAGGRLRR